MPRVSKTYTAAEYETLEEDAQDSLSNALAGLCEPLRDGGEIRGLLEEAESYTITYDGGRPVAFKIGDFACPASEEDPSNVGGRKRRTRRSRIKKQTRRSQRKRRNTIRKKL